MLLTSYMKYVYLFFRWMSIILENIANIIILSVGIFTVYTRDTISPGAAGLSLSFALQVGKNLYIMSNYS